MWEMVTRGERRLEKAVAWQSTHVDISTDDDDDDDDENKFSFPYGMRKVETF
jgi:hypothetical protein